MTAVQPRVGASVCPVCGSDAGGRVASENGFDVLRCASCGHAAVWPVPAPEVLEAIYTDAAYYEGGEEGGIGFADYRQLAGARRRMFGSHLRRLESIVPPGRVLDVGCATGDFLAVARERGWTVAGVDPSSARGDAQALGVELVGTTVHDAAVEAGSLDLVTFWDVLEHVADPVADLAAAGRLLRPGGVVALTVPDASSVLARISGRGWFGYRTAGEHLQFFTRGSLRAALERAGFEVVLGRPVAWTCSVAFLADRLSRYSGVPGRVAGALLRPAAGLNVDMPQINQLAVGIRRPGSAG